MNCFMIISPHFACQNSNSVYFFSGKESYLDRVSLAQLTQLFMTSVLECAFYKVRYRHGWCGFKSPRDAYLLFSLNL